MKQPVEICTRRPMTNGPLIFTLVKAEMMHPFPHEVEGARSTSAFWLTMAWCFQK
jgi:hypothetical protein